MQDTPVSIATDNDRFDSEIKIDLVINDRAEAFIYHNREFRKKISWVEFDLQDNKLIIIMNDGAIRNMSVPVDPKWTKYLQNAFQIMLVEMDEKTGKAIQGIYYPLIIHSV